MKKTLFLLILLFISTKMIAQEYVFGKIVSDDNRELADVSIINITNQQKTVSNSDGDFMIFANIGDEIRFTKARYNRVSRIINAENISTSLLISLEKLPYEIEEVEIKYQITGDLKKDAAHFGKSEKLKKLDEDLGTYINQKSAPETVSPKRGEFVQPVGPGFSVGGVKPQWDDIDLNEDLRNYFTQDFFVNELKLKPEEISNFIFYVLKNFERQDIKKYGRCTSADYARFQNEAFLKIASFKKNIPNESKDKSKKLQLKDKNLDNGVWW